MHSTKTIGCLLSCVAVGIFACSVHGEQPDKVIDPAIFGKLETFSERCVKVSYEIRTMTDGDVQMDYFSTQPKTPARVIQGVRPGKSVNTIIVEAVFYKNQFKYRLVSTDTAGGTTSVGQNVFAVSDGVNTHYVGYDPARTAEEAFKHTNNPTLDVTRKGVTTGITQLEEPIGFLVSKLAGSDPTKGLETWFAGLCKRAAAPEAEVKSNLAGNQKDVELAIHLGDIHETLVFGADSGLMPISRMTEEGHNLSSETQVEYFPKSKIDALPYFPKRVHYATYYAGNKGKQILIETEFVAKSLEVMAQPEKDQFALDGLPKF